MAKAVRGKGQDYEEVKVRVNVSITLTAKRLLHIAAKENNCKSLSDYLEKIARGEVQID